MPDENHDLRSQPAADHYLARESDWRNGALVYQVIVDRFAPSADLASKAHLYPAPKQLRRWEEFPEKGGYLDGHEVWSHEIDFWGGDLVSLRQRLGYIAGLGADVLYLCPIHLAWTNHGYDGLDYQQVRPEYGSRDDLKQLTEDAHARGMRVVLDGVFNHMGRNSPAFQEALINPDDPHRGWFNFHPEYPGGARAWANAVNLPELVIENPAVQDHLWAGSDSVVRSWLRDGIDGWRLDVAFELGPDYLAQLTAAAHEEKPGSLTLGEVCNYPAGWFPALDGVLNFTLREIVLLLANQQISAAHAQRMLERFFTDADYEHLLKCWNYLDNHDVPRLTDTVPNLAARKLAAVLQFTLPGSVNLYYGTELGQTGGADPANRAPMRWDLVNESNNVLRFHHQLIAIRRRHRALRIGDLRWLVTERLIGFERFTDRIEDAVIVVANPSSDEIEETVLVPESWLMDMSGLTDLLGHEQVRTHRATLNLRLRPHQVMVLSPRLEKTNGYTPYKRVR